MRVYKMAFIAICFSAFACASDRDEDAGLPKEPAAAQELVSEADDQPEIYSPAEAEAPHPPMDEKTAELADKMQKAHAGEEKWDNPPQYENLWDSFITLDLYEQVAEQESAVLTDFERFAGKLAKNREFLQSSGDRVYKALHAAKQKYPNDPRVIKATEAVYHGLVQTARSQDSFDPNRRYREFELNQYRRNKKFRDPYWCTSLYDVVETLYKTSQLTGRDDRIKLWGRHYADAQLTDHTCEGNTSWTDPEGAYETYNAIGDLIPARKAIEEAGRRQLATYAEGVYSDISGKLAQLPLEPEPLDSAKKLLRLAAWTDAQIDVLARKLLKESADGNQHFGDYGVAAMQYRKIGDSANAKRMELLAKK